MSTARTRQHRCALTRARRCLIVTVTLGFAAASSMLAREFVGAPASAAGDTAGPVLTSLSIAPASVNTVAGSASVVVTARITDDLAGLSTGGSVAISTFEFRGPGGTQLARGYLSQSQRISGTALDGIYRATIALNRYSEPGTWNATAVLIDGASNATSYTSAQLGAAGYPNAVQQTGAGDIIAPSVVSISTSPSVIDTSMASATITVSARLTDELAGVSNGGVAPATQVVMQGPTGSHRLTANLSQRVTGSSLDGVYAGQLVVPRFSEQGQWTLQSITAYDQTGNSRSFGPADLVGASFNATFQQSGLGDINAPLVAGFTSTPSIVDTSLNSASLSLRARLTDNYSGVAGGILDSPSQLTFRSPSGTQQLVASFGAAQLQSGTNLDGWYMYTATIPQGSEQGTWTLVTARLVDSAHNATTFDATEWSQLNYPAAFDVRSDGTASAPMNVLASPTASASIANVSWVPPSVVGSSAITSYTVTTTPGGATANASGSSNHVAVGGLTVGVEYTFTVHATNAAGDGAESLTSNFFIAGGTPDLGAPALSDFVIAPVAVETTSGPATISFDLSVTDDVSGIADGTAVASLSRVVFDKPDGTLGPTVSFAARQQVSGTAAIGTYSTSLTLQQNSDVGTWTVRSLTLIDGVGHSTSYSSAQLSAIGTSTAFVVTPAGAPSAPLAVSATAGDLMADVSWVAPISDGSSPITGYSVVATPSNITVSTAADTTNVSINGLRNGTVYTFVVRATNAIGTGVASARSNAVIPGTVDQTAPVLQTFSLTPLALAPSASAQTVTVGARIVDGGSGVADIPSFSAAYFLTPSGTDAGRIDFTPGARVAGTLNDGTYSAALSLPGNSVSGTYRVNAVVLIDRAGNQVSLSSAQLATLGFPTSFTISSTAPPDAPTSVSATAGDQSATVSWVAPASTGTGGAILTYAVLANPGGATAVVDASTTTAIVGGLTNGTSYTFTVSATNLTDASAASAPSNAVIPGGGDLAAPVVTSLVVSPPLVDPANGPAEVTIALHIDDVGSGLSDVPSSVLLSSPTGRITALPFAGAQLLAGDAFAGDYQIQVTLTNLDEAGLWLVNALVLRDASGNAATLDTPMLAAFPARSFVVAPGRVPSAPTNVVLSRTTDGLAVTWTVPADFGSNPLTKYTVTERTTGQTYDVDPAQHALGLFWTDFPPNTSISFVVSATNTSGSSAVSSPSESVLTSSSTSTDRPCITSGPSNNGHGAVNPGTIRGCAHIGWSPRPRLH